MIIVQCSIRLGQNRNLVFPGMRQRENSRFLEARFDYGDAVICLPHVGLDLHKRSRIEAKVFLSVTGEGSGVLSLLGGLLLADRS